MDYFVRNHIYDAEKIVIPHICDRLILDIIGGYLNNCLDQKQCGEDISFLDSNSNGRKRSRGSVGC